MFLQTDGLAEGLNQILLCETSITILHSLSFVTDRPWKTTDSEIRFELLCLFIKLYSITCRSHSATTPSAVFCLEQRKTGAEIQELEDESEE